MKSAIFIIWAMALIVISHLVVSKVISSDIFPSWAVVVSVSATLLAWGMYIRTLIKSYKQSNTNKS